MNDFMKIMDAIDVFGRKKSTGAWIGIMLYAAFILILDLDLLMRDYIPAGNTTGIWFFGLASLFFAAGLIFQLLNKPPKLFMVVHTSTGVSINKEPVTEEDAKLQVQGIYRDTFSYLPVKEYLKTKETTP